MEKVIIKSASKINDKLVKVELNDGRTGSSYSLELLEMIGKEVDVEVKAAGQYQGVQQYYFNLPKEKKAFPKKDYTVEKRIAALTAASRYQGLKSNDVLALADVYFKWLNA